MLLAVQVLAATSACAAGQALLRGRITDAATGNLMPGNVAITDAAGKLVLEAAGYSAGFRCAGEFVKPLPAGLTRIRVSRGFEYRAAEQTLELRAGTESEVGFALERVVDLRRRGWYAGDSHVHAIHGEKTIPVRWDDVALAARAEDLQYLSLAQAWPTDNSTPEALAVELGRRSTKDCVLTWNLEAPKNYYKGDAGRCLGHCWNLAMRGRTPAGQDVIRLLMDASASDYESSKPSFANFESHNLIHAQGGAVFYSHPARWWMGAWGGQGGYGKVGSMRVSNMAVELPLDVLIGPTFDGLDVITGAGEYGADGKAFELWALLLNHGYRLAATASSDSCFDRPGGATPGIARTYTCLEKGFSLPAVARATAAGRSFATTGPLLVATVEGKPPGSTFPANGQARRLQLEVWASGSAPGGLSRWELLRNGKVSQQTLFTNAPLSCQTNIHLRETENAWYCIRVFGSDPQRQRAISGAFFFVAGSFQGPLPVPARVQVRIVDGATGNRLGGTVTELTCFGTVARAGRKHALKDGEARITIPGTARLRAEAKGYRPLTLSPVFDHPALADTITRLEDKDLLGWSTYERIRGLLSDVKLTFRLEKQAPSLPNTAWAAPGGLR